MVDDKSFDDDRHEDWREGHDTDGVSYMEQVQKYYIIPPMVLSRMYEDFSPLVGDRRTRLILHQSGYRCGCKLAEGLDIDTNEKGLMEKAVKELLIQLGLGILQLHEYSANNITITCEDSNEARTMGLRGEPSCNFTLGYIRGMMEVLMGVKFQAHEKECISAGDDHCTFVLSWPE